MCLDKQTLAELAALHILRDRNKKWCPPNLNPVPMDCSSVSTNRHDNISVVTKAQQNGDWFETKTINDCDFTFHNRCGMA